MIIYNTLTGKKEKFPRTKRKIKIFVCGITAYDYAHIGHARTYLAFDTIVRYLRSRGWNIFYLQNITDIDDKIIARAKKQKKRWSALAKRFTRAFLADMKELGIDTVDVYAPATKFIPEIVRQTQTLIKKGCAYKIDGEGYYFDISKFKDYGKLSGRTTLQAEDAVSRIDEGVKKRNRGDFCLWKFSKLGEPCWKTTLGNGRPGWHIEDTAISEHYFGPQYDIHGGAVDLKFPHHEAEIAQQESASGKKPFVKLWMHTGFLLVNGEKMSKSLGNFITIRDFLKTHKPDGARLLRWITLNFHYRSPIDYSEALATQYRASLDVLEEFLQKLAFAEKTSEVQLHYSDVQLHYSEYVKKFHAAMEDDFNTPKAIGILFELISKTQKNIWNLPRKDAKKLSISLTSVLETIGLTFPTPPPLPRQVRALAEKRELYRRNKQFMHADRLRARINALGYNIEDTPRGPFLRKRKIQK